MNQTVCLTDHEHPTDEAVRLVLALARFGGRVTAATAAETNVSATVLTNSSVLALGLLDQQGEQRPSTLATSLGMTRSGTTKLVQRLRAERLVAVAQDPDDARARLVSLAPRGRDVLDAAARQVVGGPGDVSALLAQLERFSGPLVAEPAGSLRGE